MIAPDDPRHGQYSGYRAHFDAGETPCPPCFAAGTRKRKRNRYLELVGRSATLPKIGTVRRLRALQALGYTIPDIAREAELAVKTLRNPIFRGDSVYRTTADAVAITYERLSMTPAPDSRGARYARTMARKNAWAPPLAWEGIDIDDPAATAHLGASRDDQVDDVVVRRILDGDMALAPQASPAERRAVVSAWPTASRTLNDLARLTGWNTNRYTPAREGAA